MIVAANIFPRALERRLPFSSFGIDINFCRNPQCDLFADSPHPYAMLRSVDAYLRPCRGWGRIDGFSSRRIMEALVREQRAA